MSQANKSVPKVYGDWFMSEMRTICNAFDVSKQGYLVEPMQDIFTAEGQKDFVAFNPAKAMPVVIINKTNILADPATLCKHVCLKLGLKSLYPTGEDQIEER